ncbi:ATP-binding cassette domain-containing protein [Corynebacterium uterequi]|uniref:Monosaccharide ABC transporter ATP-binding protein, CUT2 family n=1 Tax=Corynebacterium uterequi TaxID=1072256 RepID=A0A0G3HLS2_9CORY|nr:ATP-binding cassette domain-containing protein [Corynebacterium uterequi]AKK12077.1 monosaccharide ABC transporter ATP-binding protein, CUT2 family [Corynebacterium uterequi]
MTCEPAPIVQLRDVAKRYGGFDALTGVTMAIYPATVTCVLGDNGAGKSTLIKILAGLHAPSAGGLLIDGEATTLASPRDALAAGISTVYQDLAVVEQMSVWRNFFLGQELTGAFGRLRASTMRRTAAEALGQLGVELRSVDAPVASLSGGQRQVVAIARVVHFGARVLILDEPTAALGVKQSAMVLRMVDAARRRGVAVVFITHNPHHAYAVGDRFVLLNRGRVVLNADRSGVSVEELARQMSGGAELAELTFTEPAAD